MGETAVAVLTGIAALGCALVGGVFFAFSSFVMPALGRLPPAAGIAAMQAVNRAAVAPPFMLALFTPAAVCVALVVEGVIELPDADAALLAAGGLLYLAGVIGVTAAYHVPRNDALAAVDPDGAAAEDQWRRYVSGWTAWNHGRTAAGLLAAVLFVVALGTDGG